VRGNLNVLLIGDPATSKTQLLKATTSLIPRARYVSGTGATSAGLIASVRRDEFTGGWVLEAGAVVLCNRSLLAVDEFEKLNKPDQVALHEVMESNSVSISKAGINATLPAHTSILAGANPKLGRFDSFMSISEQIDITPTLLSRFDVRFVLRDEPDEAKDSAIIDHIINTRLGESTPIVPPEFLVKYLLYAKRKVSEVTLTKEVLQAIKDYYTSSRKSYCMENKTLPLTLRQFEGMVRLSQAYAKLHLRTQTTLEDASNAIKLMEYSLKNLGFDPESGQIDIDRLESTTTSTQRSRTDCVLAIYNVLSSQGDVYIDDLISACESKGIPNPNKTIEEMLKRCIFYSPRSGLIEVV
jgi:replicative DNA helicase Mcm